MEQYSLGSRELTRPACVSLLSLWGELQAGVEVTREQDEARAQDLQDWVDSVAASYQVLPMDGAAFRLWAKLIHRKSDTLNEDAMIAAIARLHRLTVVTRNVGDFRGFGVQVFNPFKAQ